MLDDRPGAFTLPSDLVQRLAGQVFELQVEELDAIRIEYDVAVALRRPTTGLSFALVIGSAQLAAQLIWLAEGQIARRAAATATRRSPGPDTAPAPS